MTHYGTDESGNVTLRSDLLPVPANKQAWKDAYTGTYSSLVFAKLMRLASLEYELPQLAEARRSAMILSEVKLRPAKSANPYNGGPFLPWHSTPPSATPALSFAVSSPKLDILFAHQDRVLRDDVAGYFCGQPIVGLDELDMEVDQMRDTINRIASSSGTSIPAEVMPGEMICADNVIRRTTTREVTGEQHSILTDRLAKWCPKGQDVDDAGEPIESPVELLCVNIDEARQASKEGKIVKWRTAGESSEVIA